MRLSIGRHELELQAVRMESAPVILHLPMLIRVCLAPVAKSWLAARDAALGFGEGTSIYDSALVLGDVKVGKKTWIGPFVVLDGSGGLTIGSNCSISAGVQIYSHDSVDWAVSGGTAPYVYAPTAVGDNCYIGPNTVIAKGVIIGERCIIGANSLVLRDLPAGSKAAGSPCRLIA